MVILFTCIEIVQTPPAFLPLRRRRGTFSGSRYFTHDLLLPTDECEDEFLERAERVSGRGGRSLLRHRTRAATTVEAPNVIRHSSLLRASSLQAGRTVVHGDTHVKRTLRPSTIVRQYSSPSMRNSRNSPDINCRYCCTSLKIIMNYVTSRQFGAYLPAPANHFATIRIEMSTFFN